MREKSRRSGRRVIPAAADAAEGSAGAGTAVFRKCMACGSAKQPLRAANPMGFVSLVGADRHDVLCRAEIEHLLCSRDASDLNIAAATTCGRPKARRRRAPACRKGCPIRIHIALH